MTTLLSSVRSRVFVLCVRSRVFVLCVCVFRIRLERSPPSDQPEHTNTAQILLETLIPPAEHFLSLCSDKSLLISSAEPGCSSGSHSSPDRPTERRGEAETTRDNKLLPVERRGVIFKPNYPEIDLQRHDRHCSEERERERHRERERET